MVNVHIKNYMKGLNPILLYLLKVRQRIEKKIKKVNKIILKFSIFYLKLLIIIINKKIIFL